MTTAIIIAAIVIAFLVVCFAAAAGSLAEEMNDYPEHWG